MKSIKELIISCLEDYKSSLQPTKYQLYRGVSYYKIDKCYNLSDVHYPTAFENNDVKYALAFPHIRYVPFNAYYDVTDAPAIVDEYGNALSSIALGKWSLNFYGQSLYHTPNNKIYSITNAESNEELMISELYRFPDIWEYFCTIKEANNISDIKKLLTIYLLKKDIRLKKTELELAQEECNDLKNALKEYKTLIKDMKTQIQDEHDK